MRSCEMAGLPRSTVYDWRHADQAFAQAWDAALELGTDALEDEAVRRAYHGTDKPVYQGGKQVGTVREFSDTLLIFMLKARRPEKFKERSEQRVSVTTNGEPVSETSRWVDELAGRTQGITSGAAP